MFAVWNLFALCDQRYGMLSSVIVFLEKSLISLLSEMNDLSQRISYAYYDSLDCKLIIFLFNSSSDEHISQVIWDATRYFSTGACMITLQNCCSIIIFS